MIIPSFFAILKNVDKLIYPKQIEAVTKHQVGVRER